MLRTIKQGALRVLASPRYWLAALVGASPFVLAVMLLLLTETSNIPTDKGLLKGLADNQQNIIQSLIMSSVMVAIFSTVLSWKAVTLAAGFQPALIQAVFMVVKGSELMVLNLTLAVIITLPLAILLLTLWREVSQRNDQ